MLKMKRYSGSSPPPRPPELAYPFPTEEARAECLLGDEGRDSHRESCPPVGAQSRQEGGMCRGLCLSRVSQLTWSCLPLLPLLGRDPTRQCLQAPWRLALGRTNVPL